MLTILTFDVFPRERDKYFTLAIWAIRYLHVLECYGRCEPEK